MRTKFRSFGDAGATGVTIFEYALIVSLITALALVTVSAIEHYSNRAPSVVTSSAR